MFEFSVLMPVYIKEKPAFLDRALKSILEQTLIPTEIVIVEDGPLTDELYTVINKYKSDYPDKLNIIKLKENKGMGYAMDTGLRYCKYAFVARMDSDDIAKTDRFEKQAIFLQKHLDIDLVGSYIEEFADVPGDLNRFRKVPVQQEEIRAFAKYRNPVNHMTVMMNKKKALDAGSYWHKRVLEDYNLWYKMLLNGCRFHNLPETLVYARVGNNNMVGRRRGMGYIKEELKFFRLMVKDKFITSREFYLYSAARIILKLLPVSMLNFVYTKVLRK
ncbi:glycosyltransferase [Chitinophaga sp. CC14]|uniref:glycosyltransferase n=1 Tax=Chitinophaga sp. CC14 TaxID=3029199 RepID=UPI003B7E3F15